MLLSLLTYYASPFLLYISLGPNIVLVRLTLERRIGVKGIEVKLGKRNLSYSIVNTIGGKYLRALRRPNKGRKYNSNTLKNRNNRTKRLALLGKCPSR